MNTYGNLYFTTVLPFKENSKYTSAILFIFQRDNNCLTLRVWTLQAAQSMKEGFIVVKSLINQCIGEEVLRNYHNT